RAPEAFVLEHESVLVDGQLGLEVVLGVAVAVFRNPCVPLEHSPNGELGPDEPGDMDLRLLPNVETEATNRQRVRRRREAEIDVDAIAVPRRALRPRPQPAEVGELPASPPAQATRTSTPVVAHAESTVTA